MYYTAISFAPVQGFIERSRKLRDLIGASQILSYLSYSLIKNLENQGFTTISPALIKINSQENEQGIPNLIIVKGNNHLDNAGISAKEVLLEAWKGILKVCREYIEENLVERHYDWHEIWQHWGNYAWEVFVGRGNDRESAIKDLANNKLSRAWTAINWIGESSSLSGQDAICYPNMGQAPFLKKGLALAQRRTRQNTEKENIKRFYEDLAELTYTPRRGEAIDEENIGKYVSPQERLSLPELVKRLVTHQDIYSQLPEMPDLEKGFREMIRIPEDEQITERQWTGWFMGDGDKVSDYLKSLETDHEIHDFSVAIRSWARDFSQNFDPNFGRIIYAGGDDFLGVIYNPNFTKTKVNISGDKILDWLSTLKAQWQEHGYTKAQGKQADLNFSMSFIWAAPAVPQRDVLQHCREAENHAKSQGRNRVTIRTVFNNGQYVEWTCPWEFITILRTYRDREGGNNWGHIYGDLAQLEARHAFCLGGADRQSFETYQIIDAFEGLCEFMTLYFPSYKEKILDDIEIQKQLFGTDKETWDRAWAGIRWSRNLIRIGWQLCR